VAPLLQAPQRHRGGVVRGRPARVKNRTISLRGEG
jgi:hypothetical protein